MGYLLKKGAINTDWKVRWFLQSGARLAYYQDEDQAVGGNPPRGTIALEQCSVQVPPPPISRLTPLALLRRCGT